MYSRAFGLFLLAFPLMAAASQPKLMEASDFLMTFYIAGRMVLEGKASQLYPGAAATNLIDTPFNAFTHQVLTGLPPLHVGIYMYSPLTACIFAPFGGLTPQAALITWQVVSMAALFVCAYLIHRLTKRPVGSLFWMSVCFFPIFQTILIGHLGITLGLLPLCIGFYLLMQKRPMAAGFAWSLLLLKPQFLPTVLLVCGALFLVRRFACTIGLVLGMVALGGLTVLCVGPQVITDWFDSIRLSDTILTSPRYGYPTYLVCSMPGSLTQMFPIGMRTIVKFSTYGLAALIGLHALYLSTKLLRSRERDDYSMLPYIFLIGIFVLPLVLPHFLFYDMCVFAAAGMVVFGYKWSECEMSMKRDIVAGWIFCNLYLILWMFINRVFAQPLVVVIVAAELYRRLLTFARETPTPLPWQAKSDTEDDASVVTETGASDSAEA